MLRHNLADGADAEFLTLAKEITTQLPVGAHGAQVRGHRRWPSKPARAGRKL